MWNCDFASLVTTLFCIRNLILDLNGTGACFYHFLRKQIGGFFIAESCVDISNNWYNVGFKIVDSLDDCIDISTLCPGFIEFYENVA